MITINDDELVKSKRMNDFTLDGEEYLAKVVDVYDGDTLRIIIRFRGILTQFKARMNGYDSPEMKPLKSNANREREVIAAHAARDSLISKIDDGIVYVSCGTFDKYGRLLVTLYTKDGENINEWMMKNGHGKTYTGGTKTPFGSDTKT